MRNVIWKFHLAITDRQIVDMPEDFEIISVGEQYGKLALWAEVDSEAEKVKVPIAIVGTGHPLCDVNTLPFIGTAVMQHHPELPMIPIDGSLVWHVYGGIKRD